MLFEGRKARWAATTRFTWSLSASLFRFEKFAILRAQADRQRGRFDRGTDRTPFQHSPTRTETVHRYGVFICYEAVFADEVRQFARNGAEVLVNISDDGWYGDTSAPWQHLNMARMRAIENRRWLLRDTNNGVTAAIDPYGRVRQSIPRHQARCAAGAVRFSRRHHLLFGARRRLCVVLCHTLFRRPRMVRESDSEDRSSRRPSPNKSQVKSKPWHYKISNSPMLPCATRCATCGSIFDPARIRRELAEIETKLADPALWSNPAASQAA